MKNRSQAQVHCFAPRNDTSGAQPLTIGVALRSAASEAAMTSGGVQEPSRALAWSPEIRVSTLDEATLASVLSSRMMSRTWRCTPSMLMPPAAFTSATACS